MIGLLGKKIGMTQFFDEQGKQVPITVLEVGPCYVTDIRTKAKHGYSAIQLAFDEIKEKNVTKPRLGQFKKIRVPALKYQREIRTENVQGLSIGQTLNVDNFEVGDFVDIEGVSIGRGFQGVVKRHHFKGGASKSHGSMFGRVPGSIGASSFPSRVVKGMKAAGHMGDARVTIQSLRVVRIDKENHLLALRGSVPGVEKSYLVIRTALKKKKTNRAWKVASSTKAEASAPEKGISKESQDRPAGQAGHSAVQSPPGSEEKA